MAELNRPSPAALTPDPSPTLCVGEGSRTVPSPAPREKDRMRVRERGGGEGFYPWIGLLSYRNCVEHSHPGRSSRRHGAAIASDFFSPVATWQQSPGFYVSDERFSQRTRRRRPVDFSEVTLVMRPIDAVAARSED